MQSIDNIADQLRSLDEKRKQLAKFFIDADKSGARFKFPIPQANLDGIKICGVDGGLLKHQYHGAGLILRRAVAVCFEYKDGKLANTEYFPGKQPTPDTIAVGSEYSESDFNQLANLKREEIELQTAIDAVEKFSPNVLIRDGSIVLYPTSMPEKSSPVYKTYEEVISLYKELYRKCQEKNILLVGSVEDSRGKRYCSTMQSEIIPNLAKSNITIEDFQKINELKDVLGTTTDTLFLYDLLRVGERTAVLDYSKTSELPILKDLEEFAKQIFVLYIKAAEFDRPLRLDFMTSYETMNEIADQIASIIFEISKQNRMYSYPSILIEADARAKLSEAEIEFFKAQLQQKLGMNPALFELRRDLRPF